MARANGKRAADVLDPETRAGNTRNVLDLIDRFGFNGRHVPADFGLRFDVSDRATLADVWSRGIRARREVASPTR
jgi:hypothetical protein